MGRWKPDTPLRLARAAMELYVERGFERTTVADIARNAGLTERTFFRHFANKSEVFFVGSGDLIDALVAGVEAAPPHASAFDAVRTAFAAAGVVFDSGRWVSARLRQRVIDANPTLQERESSKLAMFATRIAAALRTRGVAEPAASLAAESGVAVFKIAFARWLAGDGTASLGDTLDATFDDLREVVRTRA